MINFNDIQIIRFDQIWIIFQIVKVLKLEKNIFLAIIWSKISKFFKKIQIIILIRWAKINNWQIRSFIFRKKMDNKWQQRQMFEDDWILNIFCSKQKSIHSNIDHFDDIVWSKIQKIQFVFFINQISTPFHGKYIVINWFLF